MRRSHAPIAFVCTVTALGCKRDAPTPVSAPSTSAIASAAVAPRFTATRELCARYHARIDASPWFVESQEYCNVVDDPCCVHGGWNCNNARYVEWFFDQCGPP